MLRTGGIFQQNYTRPRPAGLGGLQFPCCGVPAGTNFVAIAAGTCGLALRDNGTVALVGAGYGGLNNVPPNLSNVVAIATGSLSYGLALKQDGTVVGWGRIGGSTPVDVPSNFTNVTSISTFPGWSQFTLARRQDGSVVGAGLVVPYDLPFATAVAAGNGHGLAIVNTNASVPPPTILAQPQGRSVAQGATVTLTVSAAGMGPFLYQWFFNATNAIAGATNLALTFTNMQPSQSGSYSVAVSNPGGTTLSQPALITVAPALDIRLAPAIYFYGQTGRTYRLDYVTSLGATNWTPLATVALTNNPGLYVDLSAIGQPTRYYRSVQLP